MSVLYKDSLVEISDEEIVFYRYYFPSGKERHLPLSEIEKIQIYRPTALTGKWRIWGSGDFRSWAPEDYGRPHRDRAFIVHLRNHYLRIGFTVEDSHKVEGVLRDRGLSIETLPA